mmetsp:Transcript_34944/g.42747  ORF Transcript_34944/g.42747 Transcript_34944/m.42747 type:complete len:188 (-) Transcript_34944:29-592(-)
MIQLLQDVKHLNMIQANQAAAREKPGTRVAKWFRSRLSHSIRKKKEHVKDTNSMEEILELISNDIVLWTEFRQNLRDNGVVTNFHVRERLPSFINERKWEIEKLIRDKKFTTKEEEKTIATRMRSILFRFGNIGDIRRRFSNDSEYKAVNQRGQITGRHEVARRGTAVANQGQTATRHKIFRRATMY